ncbi:rod shape-determining protein MreC [Candidatus Babeliales bacterium]|nr:rod shape-determining protein MreC [Candidatus Babeliales bacterium]
MLIRQEIRLWLIHLFYVLFFLFLIHRLFFPSFGMAERCMSCVCYPFFKIHATLTHSLVKQAQDRKSIQELTQEMNVLSVQNDILKGRIAQLEAQQIFLDQTEELRSFASRYEISQKSLSKVLMCACSTQEDIIFIDGGSNKNFTKDDIVVYQQALIGRVIEVQSWYSKVALITDQRCKVAAQLNLLPDSIATDAGACGVCCGKNNQQLQLSFVPHFKPVIVGQTVISSGQGLMYPQGFELGIVTDVQTDLVSHKIEVKPMFDIHHISYVYVLHKN